MKKKCEIIRFILSAIAVALCVVCGGALAFECMMSVYKTNYFDIYGDGSHVMSIIGCFYVAYRIIWQYIKFHLGS